jgi:hypothetical protein
VGKTEENLKHEHRLEFLRIRASTTDSNRKASKVRKQAARLTFFFALFAFFAVADFFGRVALAAHTLFLVI